MTSAATGSVPVARLAGVSLSYGKTLALDAIGLDIPAGCMVGLIGPDGVGKSSLMSLVAGARVVQEGRVEALGGDMASVRHRNEVCPNIAYMPQGLGKNLYPTLSIEETCSFSAACSDTVRPKGGAVSMSSPPARACIHFSVAR